MSSLKELQDYGLPYTENIDAERVQKNIEYLYNKLSKVSKEIGFWDLYKISATVSDKNDLQSVINGLIPYTSAIINTPSSFTEGTSLYSAGDLIVKKPDGSFEHIAAERGGIFFPYQIEKTETDNNNYNYTIYYQLKSNEPTQGSVTITGNPTWDASEHYNSEIIFSSLLGGPGVSPYNIVYTSFTNMSFLKAKKGSSDIRPVVKGFDSNGEEIYWDLEVSTDLANSDNWKITNPNTSLIKTIVVK